MFKTFYTKKYKYTFIIERFPSYMIIMHSSYFNGFHKWKDVDRLNICLTLFKTRFLLVRQNLFY